MLTMLLGMMIVASPILVVAGLLWLVNRRECLRAARHARQIELTDAIHRELGAAAAPTVHQRAGGGWVVQMMVPLDRPGVVAALLGITDRVFASAVASGMLQIVLTRGPSSSVARTSRPTRPRRVESAAPAIVAAR